MFYVIIKELGLTKKGDILLDLLDRIMMKHRQEERKFLLNARERIDKELEFLDQRIMRSKRKNTAMKIHARTVQPARRRKRGPGRPRGSKNKLKKKD